MSTKAKPAGPDLPVTIPGHPHQEELTTVALSWQRGVSIDFYDKPHGTVVVREKPAGGSLSWDESVVLVFEPTRFRADKSLVVKVEDDFGTKSLARQTFSLAAGDHLDLYHYEGEGNCVVGVGVALFVAACPDPATSPALTGPQTSRPKRFEWWVRLGRRWIRIDKANVRVDVRGP